ncbi:MAG TPA: hypothetical protein VH020_01155 [Stellaceae bacterium]|nr:hypothetical protein [Stellaceae bacterium]
MRWSVPLLALVLAWPLAAAAQDQDQQPGAPLRLIVPAPASPPPAAAPDVPTGFQATPLPPIDPSWAGALPKGAAALPADMWRGTARATVRALLPLLDAAESPGLNALARRLLLSGAVAPAGDDPAAGPSLLLLRAERLEALGALVGAKTVLDAAPADRRSAAADRLRVELAFAGNDITDACRRVAAGLVDHPPQQSNVWWDQANIACQLLAGARDKAALALDILHDDSATPDPVFETLIAAASGRAAKLEAGAALSPLRVTLWAASKRPLSEAAIAGADGATLAAFAGSPDEPAANRLAAAERAAALGAWPSDRLAELYLKSAGADADRAKASTDPTAGDTPQGRAVLFAIAQHEGDAAPRTQALGRWLDAARRHGFYFVAARLAAPIILAIGPGDAIKGAVPQFIRALIAADRAKEIEPFLPLADPAAMAPLIAIVHAIEGARPDPKTMAEALAALSLQASDTTPRRIGLFLMLATEFRGAVPAPELAAQMATAHQADVPSAAVWLDAQQAQAAHRLGETVLTALALAGSGNRLTGEPIPLQRALAGLRAAGLEGDARTVALEAAIAGGL